MTDDPATTYLDLYNFRVRVGTLYRARNESLAAGYEPGAVVAAFRQGRDQLFAQHPQSALDAAQKQRFSGLDYYPYNPAAVIEATIDTRVVPQSIQIQLGDDELVSLDRAARIRFSLAGHPATLTVFWIEVYGGGLFLPFRDRTAPQHTYGGGRYLFDTVKGSDFQWLPERNGERRVTLDFNYAYNPSCAYNPRWVCPLAPGENDLSIEIAAGEKRFLDFPDLS